MDPLSGIPRSPRAVGASARCRAPTLPAYLVSPFGLRHDEKRAWKYFRQFSFGGDAVRSITECPLIITGRNFQPQDSRAKNWFDRTVSFRCFESDTRHLDATLGESMPTVRCEFTDVQSLMALGE